MLFFYLKKIFVFLLVFSLADQALGAYSDNYRIEADVIGIAGNSSGSANFNISDTLGQPVIGLGGSTNYKVQDGFWHMVNYSLSLNLDSNDLYLGTVTTGSPITGQTVISVTTDAWGGYDLLTNQNHSMTHTDNVTTISDYACSIGSPCAWSGYGLGFSVISGTSVEAKWGTSPNFNYAAFPLSATIFHSKGGYYSGADQTTVGYKVDVPASQKSGLYSNIIYYTAITKL